jgi:transposase
LLKQYRQTETLAPQTYRSRGQLKFLPGQLIILAQLSEIHNNATLEELCHLLHQKIGVTISLDYNGKNDTTVEHDFQKKTHSFHQPKAVTECKTFDMSSGSKSAS